MTTDFDEQMNDKLLTMDPLLEAEKITGKSYKEDKDTEALGFFLMQAHREALREQMESQDDTHYSSSFADVIRIYKEEGFKVVYEENFTDRWKKDTTHTILWHEDGVLAVVDSYTGMAGEAPHQNRNTLYFNWISNPGRENIWPSVSISGGFERKSEGSDGDFEDDPWILVASLYMNEGMRRNLRRLRAEGQFVKPWLSDPHTNLYPRNIDRKNDFNDPEWIAKWKAEIWADKQKYLPAEIAELVRGEKAWHDRD
jgi:hypothetical protein